MVQARSCISKITKGKELPEKAVNYHSGKKAQSGNQVIIAMQKLLGKQLSKAVATATEGEQRHGKVLMTVVLLTASSGRL